MSPPSSWWGSPRGRWDASGSTSCPSASLRSSGIWGERGRGGDCPAETSTRGRGAGMGSHLGMAKHEVVQFGDTASTPEYSIPRASQGSQTLRKRREPPPQEDLSMVAWGGQAQPQPPPPALTGGSPLHPQAVPAPHPLPLQRRAAGQGGHGPRALHLPRQPRRALRLHRHLPAERAGGGTAGAERGPLRVRQRRGEPPAPQTPPPLASGEWTPSFLLF